MKLCYASFSSSNSHNNPQSSTALVDNRSNFLFSEHCYRHYCTLYYLPRNKERTRYGKSTTMKTPHDLYRCPACNSYAGHRDKHCRGCGITFTAAHIKTMKKSTAYIYGLLPYNLRDVYRCVHCDAHIGLEDQYCRQCGDQICDKEKQLMKLNMSEIAKDNLPSMIIFGLFMAFVILLAKLMT